MNLQIGKKYRLSNWKKDWWIKVLFISKNLEWLYYEDNRGVCSKTNLTLPWIKGE